MAVLHHAFRCAITPAFEHDVQAMMREWTTGDRTQFSSEAKQRYAALADREDINAAFYLGPDGAVPSWLEPAFVSPGLAALVMLAPHFTALPALSASRDTNHALLARHLPALGWSEDEVKALISGWPIETVLQQYAPASDAPAPGGFAHTGGWTPPGMTALLKKRLDRTAGDPPPKSNQLAEEAWHRLGESKAFADARRMLSHLDSYDYLVMAITH